MIALRERREDGQRVEKIDVEPALVADHAKSARGDRIAVPEHQRNVDRHRDWIGEEGEPQGQCRQQQRVAFRLLRAFDLGDQLLGQMLAVVEVRSGELRQFAHVFERHEPQLPEQHAEHRLVLQLVFDDEARAGIVDARRDHRALGAQPCEHFLGQLAFIAKRGDGKAHAPRHEMADGELHEKRFSSLKRGTTEFYPSGS